MHGIIPAFLTAICVAVISAQAIVKDVTLMKGDVTSFNLPSLFPTPSKPEIKSKPLKGKLGQLPTSYTTSMPAAFVKSFGEGGMKLSGFDLTGMDITAYAYEDSANKLHLLARGVYFRIKYDQTAKTFTQELKLTLSTELSCTALDVTSKVVVVGCLYRYDAKADFYSIVGDKASPATSLTFEAGSEIKGGLRVDINTNSDEFVVFGDLYRRSGESDPAKISFTFFTVDATTGDMSWTNTIDSIITSDSKTVNFDQLNECYLIALETTLAYVSGFVRETQMFDTYRCSVVQDGTTKHFTLNDCTSMEISKLNIQNGRVKFFPGKLVPSIAVYDAGKEKIGECELDETTEKFTDCVWSNRLLPVQQGADLTVFITNYNGSPAFTFKDVATEIYTGVVNVDRVKVDETTSYLRFDSIIESKPKAIMALEKNDATVLYDLTFKHFNQLAASDWTLQISANDLPVPSSGSTVKNKRGLIRINRKNPDGEIWVKVEVLDQMDSKMGFSDDLPDFGGLTGGYTMANLDRSWIYGNDLEFKITSDALDKPILLDRVNFKFTHSKDTNVFTKVFVLQELNLVAQDANNLYYYECGPSKENNNECEVKQTFKLPEQGYEIKKVFPSTSFPNVPSSTSIAVYLTDSTGKAFIYFIWLADAAGSTLYTVPYAARDLHMINFKDTLMFFVANAEKDTSMNIDVWGVANLKGEFAKWTAITSITPAKAGLPADPRIAPTGILSCGHNDYVVEFLTGNGYIAKFNILGTKEADIQLRAILKIVHPTGPNFVAAGFCAMGDEFIVWNSDYSIIFSTSTANDDTIYNLGLNERGISRVTHITCATRSASAGIWAQNNDFKKVLITLYGNQFNTAHSKIHSIELLEANTAITYAGTFSMTDSGVAQVSITGGNTYVKYMVLGGPYLLTGFKDTVTSPDVTMTLTSGNEVRTLNIQLNLQAINRTIYVGEMRENITLDKGELNLEKSRDIVGHVDNVELRNVPDSLKDVITLQQRINKSASQRAVSADAFTPQQIVAYNDKATMFFGTATTSGKNAVLIKVDGKETVFEYPTIISIVGRVDSTFATYAYLTRVGGTYTITVVYFDYAAGTTAQSSVDSGSYLNSLKIAKVPGANPSFAIFASNKMNNQWIVYEASKGDNTIKQWDVLTDTVNVWPVDTDEVGLVFFNNLRDYTFNVYSMQDATVKKGTVQSGIQLSGSKAEIKDVSCHKPADKTVDCVFVTYGPTSIYSTITIDKTGQITRDPDTGNYNIKSRSLFNFADNDAKTGSYISGKIVPGHILLMSMDRTFDLYKTADSVSNQGYLYARIPAYDITSRKSLKSGLKFTRVHDTLEEERTYTLSVSGSESMISTINPPSVSNAVTMDTYTSQPLVLSVKQELNDEATTAAKGITISLGSFAQPTTFNLTDFFLPKPPKPTPPSPTPEPEKKNLTWLWIVLAILGVLIIGLIAYFVFARRKEFGAEEDAYNKHEPFVGDEKEGVKRKNSDEFN